MKIKKLILSIRFLAICSLLLILPNYFSFPPSAPKAKGYWWEEFDSTLANRLQSVSDVLVYTDSIAQASGIAQNTLNYGVILNRVIKKRFYHGYSRYTMDQNWLAVLAGKYFWSDLSAPVLPGDILKFPMAACSQQSIVLIECFRKKKIPFRKVSFKSHFAVEGEFNNKWYYFDPDLEPDLSKYPRSGIDSIVKHKGLPLIYFRSNNSLHLEQNLSSYSVGEPNKFPAPNASLFHKVTAAISKWAWIVPFVLMIILALKKRVIVKGAIIRHLHKIRSVKAKRA